MVDVGAVVEQVGHWRANTLDSFGGDFNLKPLAVNGVSLLNSTSRWKTKQNVEKNSV